MVSPQVTNLVIMLGMMQVSRKIPFDDPNVLNGCRAAYLFSNFLIALVYIYILSKINAKKGASYYTQREATNRWYNGTDMTTLKYVEPPAMGSSEEPKLVTTTIHAYDSSQLKQLFRSQAMGVAMMAFMHLYMKYTNPLLVQSIIPLKSALESNLAKIYIWGQPASGELKRPFKAGGGFMSGLQSGPAQSDKKTVEAAERAGRGGAKEE
ncbi:inorganic phosphate transport protein PHO88 [Sodiomyces alkalinus F11]|uniref:Inorganic phosphate transport protein PHO88 n=1 Tax=Sodiomyces alkalinus (strain CBS 110278 / VKM F-3762 / F11) TaxID=1314773 RepID=A0A3N2Q6N7_SODAK|nr:inorganic phosphate transport protein PHO88 [Sodiomyces alkalinus F11]ROT42412.1 inorganic phosphate transport protein PHO88 [Sodiomyces alkalinus F11]